ncbi:MAG: exo-alpha-sialidase [Verrucomicrobia bacterium]|nr:exo-alpha-sialidase [Verrucomicrobiota bacterium]
MPPRCARLLTVLSLLQLFARAEVTPLGDRRELFVDRALIERLDRTELRLQTPRPAGVVFRFDRPWEGIVSGYVTVLEDAGRFLLYYRGRPSTSHADASDEAREVSCVAESLDGVHWTRPNLGLFEVAGTRDNNVFLVEPKTVTHNFCPFIDRRPGVPADQRFKAVGGTGAGGLFGYESADGRHWRPVRPTPLITQGQFDSQNVVFWSEPEQRYCCYFRTWTNDVRWIARSTSTNFLDWTAPEPMEFGDAPPEHLYINQTRPYARAPHLYVGIAARFNPGRQALTPGQVRDLDLEAPWNYPGLRQDDSDAVLLTSRGGRRYDRTFLESFLRPGLDPRNWVARANYPALGLLQTAPDELSLYVVRHYGQPSIHLERLTLRPDGLASLHAGYTRGECLTRPITFSGDVLELNLSTSAAGFVRVEIQDDAGTPLPGFALSDCPELIGDALSRPVAWTSGARLREIAGKPVQIRFVLKDADLFSFRFQKSTPTGEVGTRSPRPFVTVFSDGGAGRYEAFPDVCRLRDGRLQCITYASYTHVGVPSPEWPLGGRIVASWSSDEGRTWTPPETLLDTPVDDRDPSITQLRDGRLLCSFFTTAGTLLTEAQGPSGPWSSPRLIGPRLGVSTPVRELSDGTLILGVYFEDAQTAHGATLRSLDHGRTWEPPAPIDSRGQFLDAETDVIELKDGGLLAALRGGKGAPMNLSRSQDRGAHWIPAEPLGFVGHCPYLHRAPGGEIVLAYRQPVAGETRGTALRVSRDEGRSWSEATRIDPVIGAYPSIVNLRDGSLLIVYYEEGEGSDIRARRLRIEGDTVKDIGWPR